MRARLAERGFPCARPLTPAVAVGTSAAHAEVYRSGGDLLLLGDGPDVAERYAAVFARLMADLADAPLGPPLPNPRWVRWERTDPGLWPLIDFLGERDQNAAGRPSTTTRRSPATPSAPRAPNGFAGRTRRHSGVSRADVT